jgi:cardiolipin synthase
VIAQRYCTVSNFFSASRIALVFPIGYCLVADFLHHRWWTAGLIALGVATDFLDGFLARRLHQVTDVGKIIDPVADKIAVGAYALLMAWTGDVPLWFVVLVLLRDLLIFSGGLYILRAKRIVPQSNWPGKISISLTALVFFLATIQVEAFARLFSLALWASVVMAVWSVWVYTQRLFIGRNIEQTR